MASVQADPCVDRAARRQRRGMWASGARPLRARSRRPGRRARRVGIGRRFPCNGGFSAGRPCGRRHMLWMRSHWGDYGYHDAVPRRGRLPDRMRPEFGLAPCSPWRAHLQSPGARLGCSQRQRSPLRFVKAFLSWYIERPWNDDPDAWHAAPKGAALGRICEEGLPGVPVRGAVGDGLRAGPGAKSGIKTPQEDVKLIGQRLRRAQQDYEGRGTP